MRVEVLTSLGCPNAAAAKETVVDCLAALGIDTPIIDRVGPYPSPTILIDGVDVMRPEDGAPTGNSCRLDLPTTTRVLDALRTNTGDERKQLHTNGISDT
ncbi:alkylmercury lyase [Mycobacterium sp. AZCC_0083]|uniref:alkylmercury lyase n=1 Tax=Mycobacterium sp. AZCC_0083 TaxID=2735882 RepID=UPI0016123ECA|nr:alkylmercury lyase [Mycobacterium sp. AZCC_0083]